jgi:acyl-CoA synthetase (AMP-forming)/AMP-acid ligase II
MEQGRVKRLKARNRNGFVDRFRCAASACPEAVAFEVAGQQCSWTYAQLLDLAEQLRAALEKLEVEKGDRILLLLPSSPAFIASIYSLTSLSAISIPTDYSLSDYEMGRLLKDAKPVGLVTNSAIYASYQRLFEQQEQIRFVLNMDSPCREISREGPRFASLHDFVGKRSALEPPPDDPIITCHYTYKGLGVPLGTLHRYHNYSFCIEGLERKFPLDRGDVNLLALPLHSVYGLTMLALGPLCVGSRLVLVEQIRSQNFIDLLERYNVRATCVVPLLVPKLMMEAKAKGGKATLELNPDLEVGSTAAYLDGNTIGAFADATGVEIQQGFGLTEALAVTSTSTRVEHRGTLGTPISEEMEVRIVDVAGREVPPGQTGEIVVEGPTVADGFLKKPAAESRFFRGSRFRTGDLGYKDRAGLLHFAGRAAPIAKIGSQMVDLLEVEQVLALHPQVVRAKVVVRGQMDRRNYISASVVVSRRAGVEPQELRKFCRAMLSRHKVPTEVKICESHPSSFYDRTADARGGT